MPSSGLDSPALEGTGSLLFDHENRIIYCALSPRADPNVLKEFLEKFNALSNQPYETVTWHSYDPNGNLIYHTNVIMALFSKHAILCTDSITSEDERQKLLGSIKKGGRAIISIDYSEMLEMAGNMLMLRNAKGEECVVMSERARRGLKTENLKIIEDNYKIISSDISIIEIIGGGSARCMLAELF